VPENDQAVQIVHRSSDSSALLDRAIDSLSQISTSCSRTDGVTDRDAAVALMNSLGETEAATVFHRNPEIG
jgi:hypothetical protein